MTGFSELKSEILRTVSLITLRTTDVGPGPQRPHSGRCSRRCPAFAVSDRASWRYPSYICNERWSCSVWGSQVIHHL